MDGPELTLYYDGSCAFCCAGMQRLKRWDRAARLQFVDIAAPGFSPRALGLGMQALNTEMHATTADGKLLKGIDSMLAAYALAGQGWRVAPLRVRWLRPVLAVMYRSFARNRYRISAWLGYDKSPVCTDSVCSRGRHFL
jgi:predicted DCC family thiol-disulfide oxidoreductase YuxK